MGAPAAPRVKFSTLGCRLNQAESDSMAEQLGARAFVVDDEDPDVVVVNTCTVTREATKASRSALRRAARTHPNATVVAIGCYAVSDPDEVSAIEGVDLVLGNDAKEAFAEALGAAPATQPLLRIGFAAGRAAEAAGPEDAKKGPDGGPASTTRVRANIKVQTGCDEWCTFCIIPTTRGALRSFDADKIVRYARTKVVDGARELVLTGVHLGKYGYDWGGDEKDLLRLLERLLKIPGVRRLRLSSILSNHLTDEVVEFMAADERVCPHLHVPLQSGDDGVLEAMHRPYRVNDYVDAVENAQRRIPGLALATDIIVGFPTEDDDAFEATMDIVRRIQFSKLHVFRYSARPGTPAAGMTDAVHPDVRKLRSKRLIDLGNEIRYRWLHDHLRDPLEVLVEDERVVESSTVSSGQTADYARVWFEGGGLLGSTVCVHGERVRADGIAGRLIEGRA